MLMRRTACMARTSIVSVGQNMGKFTHSGNFRLTIGAVDIISQKAQHKVWLKPATEMNFLHGNHVLTSEVARMTESTPA